MFENKFASYTTTEWPDIEPGFFNDDKVDFNDEINPISSLFMDYYHMRRKETSSKAKKGNEDKIENEDANDETVIIPQAAEERARQITSASIQSQAISQTALTNEPDKYKRTFDTKEEFINTLNYFFKKALIKYNRDPRLSEVLVAQNILESGWKGASVKGDYNFGNITTKGNDWHIKSSQGHHWKDFKSIEDYADYKIQYLNRKYDFYSFANLNNIAWTMQKLADSGYDRNSPSYGSKVASIYKTMQKYLKK